MLFSSATFLFCFLPVVLLGYFICKNPTYRNYFLLAASLLFFSWGHTSDLIILLISILINYFTGLFLCLLESKSKKFRFCIIASGVIINLLLLIYYKYYTFLLSSLNDLFSFQLSVPNIVLPIGISFFTFQGMSYIIDVYRRTVQGNKNLPQVALYIALFPQLIAGPIVKYSEINQQIAARSISLNMFSYGIERFILGLAKKVLISNFMGETADTVFGLAPEALETPTAWLGIICYTLQIYFDFSGYSDMAIGLGQMFGFSFNENFNYPYISSSITEFWRRWHISLSSWFRDYLYIPLGGNRKGNVYVNLFIVFCATGIWHGANWTFLLWGLWHGMFIIIEKFLMKKGWFQKIPVFIRFPSTIFIVIMGWVMFRAENIEFAFMYYQRLFGIGTVSSDLLYTFASYIDTRVIAMIIIAIIASTPILSLLVKRIKSENALTALKIPALFSLMACSIIYIVNGGYNPFIYFQF